MSMVVSHLIWMLRTRQLRQRARSNGLSFDECQDCVQWQACGLDLGGKIASIFAKQNSMAQETVVHTENDRITAPINAKRTA